MNVSKIIPRSRRQIPIFNYRINTLHIVTNNELKNKITNVENELRNKIAFIEKELKTINKVTERQHTYDAFGVIGVVVILTSVCLSAVNILY